MPALNYEIREYRDQFNSTRFRGFNVIFRETDLWIGVRQNSLKNKISDPDKPGKDGSCTNMSDIGDNSLNSTSAQNPNDWQYPKQSCDGLTEKMKEQTIQKIKELRKTLDDYIFNEPRFSKSLTPFIPAKEAPPEAVEMADAAAKAGVGPMASVAGLFAREAGLNLKQNFLPHELVIENGGDIFADIKDELVLSVFAGRSPLSGKIGLVIPPDTGQVGICTSAGTVGPSLSFGQADAVVVVCKNILLADAFATALGN